MPSINNKSQSLAALVIALMLMCANVASAQTAAVAPTVLPPHIIKTWYHHPPALKVTRIHFTPWPHPSPQRLREIIAYEHHLWGGTSILDRAECESELDWNAKNGQYRGILQIGPWWDDVYPDVTPRKVKFVTESHFSKPVFKFVKYSDKHIERRPSGHKEVTSRVIHLGTLPAKASPYNAWAAARVGQRAAAGVTISTDWSCSL